MIRVYLSFLIGLRLRLLPSYPCRPTHPPRIKPPPVMSYPSLSIHMRCPKTSHPSLVISFNSLYVSCHFTQPFIPILPFFVYF